MPTKEKSSKSEASKEMRSGKSSQERSQAAKELASGNKAKSHGTNTNKSH
ncbi:MAG TPA: hypothetical protein VHB54_01805 [Mucilaginibacter sp.]|nr:hypothetical protein [Mucilaginibacter sp.]